MLHIPAREANRVLITSQGITTLARYGVEGETPDVRRAALRCVANALLLDGKMRQVFVDTGYGSKLSDMLKVCLLCNLTYSKTDSVKQAEDSEDEMVASRILFYTTYDTTMDFGDLIKSYQLADNVAYVSLMPYLQLFNILIFTATGPPRETVPENGTEAIITNGRIGTDRHPQADI